MQETKELLTRVDEVQAEQLGAVVRFPWASHHFLADGGETDIASSRAGKESSPRSEFSRFTGLASS